MKKDCDEGNESNAPAEPASTTQSQGSDQQGQDGVSPIVAYYDEDNVQEMPGAPNVKQRHQVQQINPEDLIDLHIYDYYQTKKGNKKEIRGRVKERTGPSTYRVQFDNGKNRTYEYEEVIALANRDDEEDAEKWDFEKIIGHRWSPDKGRRGKIDVQIKWEGYKNLLGNRWR